MGRTREETSLWPTTAAARRHVVHACVLTMAIGALAFGALSRPHASQAALPETLATPAPAQHAIVAKAIPSTENTGTLETLRLETAAAEVKPEPATPPSQKPAPELKSYVVQDGDNPYDLAQSLGISEETLLAANGLYADSVLQIGQKLLVPPVTGIVVSTQAGDTVKGLADQWKIDLNSFMTINKLDPKIQSLVPGEAIVLPGVTPPVQIYPITSDDSETDTGSVVKSVPAPARQAAAQPARAQTAPAPAPIDTRPAVTRSGPNNFPWGQCTWWAAQSRPDIGSRVIGNAASWLYSARAAGLPTGTAPRVGAIVVYQPGAQGAAWTGHVAYVTSVSGSSFTVSEMNFPYWGVVTHRASHTGPGVSFIY